MSNDPIPHTNSLLQTADDFDDSQGRGDSQAMGFRPRGSRWSKSPENDCGQIWRVSGFWHFSLSLTMPIVNISFHISCQISLNQRKTPILERWRSLWEWAPRLLSHIPILPNSIAFSRRSTSTGKYVKKSRFLSNQLLNGIGFFNKSKNCRTREELDTIKAATPYTSRIITDNLPIFDGPTPSRPRTALTTSSKVLTSTISTNAPIRSTPKAVSTLKKAPTSTLKTVPMSTPKAAPSSRPHRKV